MGETKKILVLSEVFYPEIGSGANRITNIVLLLKQHGYKVDVITSEPSYPDRSLYESKEYFNEEKQKRIYDGSEIISVKGSKVIPTANFFNRLYIYLFFLIKCVITVIFRKNKYDLVITTTPSIFMGLLGVIAKVRYRTKLIIDIRDLWPECIKNIGLFRRNKLALNIGYKIEKFILKFTDSVVVNSYAYKEYLERKGYKKTIRFIPNGLTEAEINDLKGSYKNSKKNEKFTVIYTGLIGLAQNVKTIVRVANHLRENKDIQFKIIGTGIQTNKVQHLIEHYGLTNIEVISPMPKHKAIEEVKKSHIAVAHLRKDSAFDLAIPGKLIDYMAIGIPIIAGVEGYTASVLMESGAGFAIEPDDCREIAKSIIHMYSNELLREVCSENGQIYCESNFNWENNFSKYIEVIEGLLGREENEKKSLYVRVESLHQ
ncbi:MAG: glycosyltransferase family 4 protein [Clostridium sp.]